ncbi:MAG: DUF1844 domain-containing protein [Myxococcales bacterium]|nr:DUF1844 domain-containing protein [Myxococcales bacterium]
MSDQEEGKNAAEELPAAGEHALPALDISTFILSVVGSALVHLGDAPDPETGAAAPTNLLLARQNIDLIALLQEKTKGNLTGEEERIMTHGLYDLRMRYVEVAKAQVEVAKAK